MFQEDIVKEYRKKVITGLCLNLIPLNEKILPDIVRLRNQDRSRHYLNQNLILTLDMQKKWYNDYLKRLNDIYWCIQNKEGIIIGTIRLYDITKSDCNQGSFILDENYSMGLPYALETELITLDFAFNTLKIKEVINEDRIDNKMMNSISKKMGFKFEKKVNIRDIEYNRYILKKEDLKLERYRQSLNIFMNR